MLFFRRRKSRNSSNEILEPKLVILDETDSGLDIDALRIVADGVNSHKNKITLLIITLSKIADYIKPDFIHVLSKGKIVKTGYADLGKELEKADTKI